MSGAKKILGEAHKTLEDREDEYGDYHDMLGLIADYWSLYLGDDLGGDDVAVMMALFKVARSSYGTNRETADDLKDGLGYLAMASDLRDDEDLTFEEPTDTIKKTVEIRREESPDWARTEESFEDFIRTFGEEGGMGWKVTER